MSQKELAQFQENKCDLDRGTADLFKKINKEQRYLMTIFVKINAIISVQNTFVFQTTLEKFEN